MAYPAREAGHQPPFDAWNFVGARPSTVLPIHP